MRWGDIANASHAIEVAIHKTLGPEIMLAEIHQESVKLETGKHHEQSLKLWKAKVLVDEVRNEAQADGEFALWLEDAKAERAVRAEWMRLGVKVIDD